MRPKHKSRGVAVTPARKPAKRKNRKRRKDTSFTSFTSLHYRLLLDALEIGTAIVSGKGDIRYANSRFADMIGASDHPILEGTNLRSHLTASSWAALCTALERSRRVPAQGQIEVQVVSGAKRMIRVSFIPLSQGKPEPLTAVVTTEATRMVEAEHALRQSEASLQVLSARLLQVQDDERRHMARDLHDTIGQELAVAVMRVEQIAKDLSSPDADVRKELAECSEWLRKIEAETRTLSYVLHPPLLDQIGLVPALGWYIEGFCKRSGLGVKLDVQSNIPRLDVDKEIALFRIVQESLTNVLRHSGSPEATVRVAMNAGSVCVSVEDKGKGFKNETPRKKTTPEFGVGIAGMRGRLSLVQGELDIQSSRHGSTVSARVPLKDRVAKTTAAEIQAAPAPARETPQPAAQAPVARILIADDHEIARRGIRDLFRDEPEFEICGEARDGVEALAKAQDLHPDMLILDLSMPKLGGFSVANQLRRSIPSIKILVYSTHSHPDVERMARATGCSGCVHKANAARDLVRGVKTILRGGDFYERNAPQMQMA